VKKMKQPTNIPPVETTYEPKAFAKLLELSHQATALLVAHFHQQKHPNPADAALHRLGELAGGKLYYETVIRMTNKEREEKLIVVNKILKDLRAGKF
jgi:hypothetical protein